MNRWPTTGLKSFGISQRASRSGSVSACQTCSAGHDTNWPTSMAAIIRPPQAARRADGRGAARTARSGWPSSRLCADVPGADLGSFRRAWSGFGLVGESAGRAEVVPGRHEQPGDRADNQRGRGRLGAGDRGRPGAHRGRDCHPEREARRAPPPDPEQQRGAWQSSLASTRSRTWRGGTCRSCPGPAGRGVRHRQVRCDRSVCVGWSACTCCSAYVCWSVCACWSACGFSSGPSAPPAPDGGLCEVGQGLTAAGTGPQHGIGGGGDGEPGWVAPVGPVRVGCGGDPAPGRAHLVVAQVRPRDQPQDRERIIIPGPAHGVSFPQAVSFPDVSSRRRCPSRRPPPGRTPRRAATRRRVAGLPAGVPVPHVPGVPPVRPGQPGPVRGGGCRPRIPVPGRPDRAG